MFELEKEIAIWRQAIVADGVVGAEEDIELESHLRESIVALREQELSEQEAFWVAANRLGHPTDLQHEYAKNNYGGRWRHRLFWMLVGSLGFKAIGGTVSAIGAMTGVAMAYSGFGGSASGAVMIAVMAIVWGSVFTLVYRRRQYFGRRREGLSLKWMVMIGMLLVLAPVIGMFERIPATFREISWYSEAAYCLSVGGLVLNFCIMLLCFAALWRFNDRAWKLD